GFDSSTSRDSWMKAYNEATKLVDDINCMISEKTGLDKISLESLSSKLPSKNCTTGKELNHRKDMLLNLRTKMMNQMPTTLNMSPFANTDSLLGLEKKLVDAMTKVYGLDNQSHSVLTTKHIALTMNEELDLHTSHCTDNLDQHIEFPGSRIIDSA
ncbi:Syntaxin-51, partial [Bienertia sinuspersici]